MAIQKRLLLPQIEKALARGKSVLLLGARQTGKTTLLTMLKSDLFIDLVVPAVRQRYERDTGILAAELEALPRRSRVTPLVLIDEVQKIPTLMDAVQSLVDAGKARFVLTGSSARKLKRGPGANLLPGRVVALRMDPMTLSEMGPLPSLRQLLLYGSLPSILRQPDDESREVDLHSYVTTYLEEEIREEALVRNVGVFSRFLELAGVESGNICNYSNIAQDMGTTHTTVSSYFGILEDTLILERVGPLVKTQTRKRLSKTPKHLIFDLGVRRLCAHEGLSPTPEHWGRLFEQFVGLELIRSCRLQAPARGGLLRHWRDHDGREVDWVIDSGGDYLPVEVKWTEHPTSRDARGLEAFLGHYKQASQGLLVCRTPRKMALGKGITAIPWQELPEVVK